MHLRERPSPGACMLTERRQQSLNSPADTEHVQRLCRALRGGLRMWHGTLLSITCVPLHQGVPLGTMHQGAYKLHALTLGLGSGRAC